MDVPWTQNGRNLRATYRIRTGAAPLLRIQNVNGRLSPRRSFFAFFFLARFTLGHFSRAARTTYIVALLRLFFLYVLRIPIPRNVKHVRQQCDHPSCLTRFTRCSQMQRAAASKLHGTQVKKKKKVSK